MGYKSGLVMTATKLWGSLGSLALYQPATRSPTMGTLARANKANQAPFPASLAVDVTAAEGEEEGLGEGIGEGDTVVESTE